MDGECRFGDHAPALALGAEARARVSEPVERALARVEQTSEIVTLLLWADGRVDVTFRSHKTGRYTESTIAADGTRTRTWAVPGAVGKHWDRAAEAEERAPAGGGQERLGFWLCDLSCAAPAPIAEDDVDRIRQLAKAFLSDAGAEIIDDLWFCDVAAERAKDPAAARHAVPCIVARFVLPECRSAAEAFARAAAMVELPGGWTIAGSTARPDPARSARPVPWRISVGAFLPEPLTPENIDRLEQEAHEAAVAAGAYLLDPHRARELLDRLAGLQRMIAAAGNDPRLSGHRRVAGLIEAMSGPAAFVPGVGPVAFGQGGYQFAFDVLAASEQEALDRLPPLSLPAGWKRTGVRAERIRPGVSAAVAHKLVPRPEVIPRRLIKDARADLTRVRGARTLLALALHGPGIESLAGLERMAALRQFDLHEITELDASLLPSGLQTLKIYKPVAICNLEALARLEDLETIDVHLADPDAWEQFASVDLRTLRNLRIANLYNHGGADASYPVEHLPASIEALGVQGLEPVPADAEAFSGLPKLRFLSWASRNPGVPDLTGLQEARPDLAIHFADW